MTFKASHMAESGMDLECFIPLLPSALERGNVNKSLFSPLNPEKKCACCEHCNVINKKLHLGSKLLYA